MDSLKRGLIFFSQTWQLARVTPGLLIPTRNTLLAGLGVTLVGLVLAALLLIFLPGSLVGAILAGFFVGLAWLGQLLCGYIFSGAISGLFYQNLNAEPEAENQVPIRLRQRWPDLLSLAVGLLPLLVLRRKTYPPPPTYLIRPVLMVEDLPLPAVLQRVDQIARDNLVMMLPGQVGVHWFNALLGGVMTVLGTGLGVLAGFEVQAGVKAASATPLAILTGIFVASLFTLAAVALGSLNASVYHTCLYIWTRRAETSRLAGRPSAIPPQPLAAALSGVSSLSAPIYLN